MGLFGLDLSSPLNVQSMLCKIIIPEHNSMIESNKSTFEALRDTYKMEESKDVAECIFIALTALVVFFFFLMY